MSTREFNRAMNKIEKDSISILKKHTPVKSGRLRNSMTSMGKQPAKQGVDLRSGIKIGSPLPYAIWVDKGTKQSTGRYVPVLGRRVRTGTHPGVRARNYVEAAIPKIEEKSKMTIERFERQWRRTLRL